MAKTHYGYKDGQFKQGKCEVTTGTCPYGNHSEDPNKINDLREYVAKTLNENPNYQVAYEKVARMHGEKNVTAALLTQLGVPAKLAKAWANEPVSEEYERDYVADGTATEPEPVAEPEPVTEEESLVEVNPAEDNLWGTAAADKYQYQGYSNLEELETFEDSEVYKTHFGYYESDRDRQERITGNRAVEEFEDLAKRVRNPEFFGKADPEKVEEVFGEPYKTLQFINKELQTDWARRHPGKPLPDELRNLDEMDALVNFNIPGNEVSTNIIATDVRKGALGITPEAREFARSYVSVASVLGNEARMIPGWHENFVEKRKKNLEATGKDPELEVNRLAVSGYLEKVAHHYQNSVDGKAEFDEESAGASVEQIKEDSKVYIENDLVYPEHHMTMALENKGKTLAEKTYYKDAADHWSENLKPGAYVMMGSSDAEVYTLQEDGGITSPDGKLSGYVDYKTGVFYNLNGSPVLHSKGAPRLFEDDKALMEKAIAGGGYGRYPAPFSSDPGYFSKYELSDSPRVQSKVAEIRNFLANQDDDYREIAWRNESIYKATNNIQGGTSDDIKLHYEALKDVGFRPLARMERGGTLSQVDVDRAKMDMMSFVGREISAGRLSYVDGEYRKNDGASIEMLENRKLDYNRIFDKDDDVATRVSIVNAVRRAHNTETSYRTSLSFARSKPLTRHEPVARRRRDWGETPSNLPPRVAVEDNLLIGDKVSRNGIPVTYLVVDDANRLMVEVPRRSMIGNTLTKNSELDAPVSDDELNTLKARYLAGDKALNVVSIKDETQEAGKLRVW